MNWNQNETSELRVARREARVLVSLTPTRNSQLATRGFTLTELLVVITIIAILAGLITGAAVNALNKSKQASITLEIQQLSNAIEDFKNEYGAYPPNGMNPGPGINNILGNGISPIVVSDFQRMFKKAFPRSNEPNDVIRALAGLTTAGGTASPLPGGMNAAEALYFWLGGFSSDPQYPISGPGGPSFADTNGNGGVDPADEVLENRNRRYEFDLGRLGPRDANGAFHDTNNGGVGRYITYTLGGIERRINFWLYTPNGSQQPIAYFDTSRHDPAEYDIDLSGIAGMNIFAIKQLREGFSQAAIPTVNDIVFVNKSRFQILHAGLDDTWGNFSGFRINNAASVNDASAVLLYPTGPFTGDIADTVGNFMTGTLEDEQE